MLKSKLKEVGLKILGISFNLFAGSGVSNIPGVRMIFYWWHSILASDKWVMVDGQIFYPYIFFYLDKEGKFVHSEPHVSSLFCSLLKEGMTVVDVGAGEGYYTLLAAKRVGGNGLVVSFEPEPYRFNTLLKNIKANGWNNVRPFQIAISDKRGKRRIKGETGFVGRKWIGGATTINTAPLDSFLQYADVVIIDVEGAELEVLRGMGKILGKGNAKIICEVHPSKILSLGYSTTDILDLLKQYNYSIYLINEEGSGLTLVTDIPNKFRHYLFTKEKME